MNSKTLAKIEASAPFLLQFRHEVPVSLQTLIAPYLDQPYQLALKVLDCCIDGTPVSIDEIAAQTGLNKVTVRQVLTVFQNNGIEFQIQPKRWQMRVAEPRSHRAAISAVDCKPVLR